MTDRIIIPESVVDGPAPSRLGRHILHDDRSWDFPAKTAPQVESVEHEAHGLPLDQGDVGSCTANALIGALNCAPNFSGTARTEVDAQKLYHDETVLEGQPWPPNDPGGTGIEVCKAAKNEGLIGSYTHTFSLDDALKALVVSPVIIGINWYDSFDSPDPNGLVQIGPNATVRGGHEVVLTGIDAPEQLVWAWNSWGTSYGLGGRFCMSFSTLGRLLSEQGDCTVPVVKVPAPTPPSPPAPTPGPPPTPSGLAVVLEKLEELVAFIKGLL